MALGGAVLELFAKLGLDSSQYDKGLEGAKSKFSGFASFLGGVGTVGAAAFAAVGTATIALGKSAVEAYSNYEQLSGGIEKLFGEESAGIVAEYAEKAFMTSGKSINEYYNSVSQITASLKRSIGDDMGEVARVADVAMQVISDNVNVFGSNAESVENAIMGLSRQNYTMIDNLKLGYAGTAQGMLELINDSGVLGRTLTDTSELATVGFDQMILAIQKVQENQGIAGTTAKEAMRTIEGSAKATKAAWQNVITAIGRGEGLSEALGGLTTAIFGENEGEGLLAQIIPRIQTTMESIGEFVVEAAPLLAERIPEILNSILPVVFETVTNLFARLSSFIFEKLPDILSTLYEVAQNMVSSTASFILENLPSMLSAGIEMLNSVADGIRNNLPEILAAAAEFITEFLGEIIYELPDIIAAGVNIVMALIEGLVNSIPAFLDGLGVLIQKAWDAIMRTDWIGLGKNIIRGIADGIANLGHIIGDKLMSIARNAWSGVKSFFGISSPSKLMRDTVGKFIPLGMAEGIEDEADSVFDAMDDLNSGAMDSFDTVFDDVSRAKISGLGGAINYGGLTFNIYGSEGQDVEEIAQAVKQIIIDQEERTRLVYA